MVTRKVDRLSCVRFGSARYSVPNVHIGRTVELRVRDGVITVVFLGEIIAEHLVVSPGETSINDDHYGGPRPIAEPGGPAQESPAEKTFCALGPVADAFIKGAAAHGMTGLARDLEELSQLEAIHGRAPVIAALERAVAFGRFRAADVVSILDAGHGAPRPTRPGEALIVELPIGPGALAVGLRHRARVMTTTPPPLAPDMEAGLRRLRLSAMRKLSPELLVTAKTQRWKPEEFLRTLIEAEIASRDLSNARARMKVAAFPVTKTLEEFDVAASSVERADLRLPGEPRVDPGQGEPLSGRAGRHRQEPSARRPRPPRRRASATGSATSPPPTSSRPSTGLWPTTRWAKSSPRS